MTPELREAIKTILLLIEHAEITNDSVHELVDALSDLTDVISKVNGEHDLLEARVCMLEADRA
jgi:hypothetical protein